jgi:hypothetical protein
VTRKRTTLVRSPATDYGGVLADVVGLVDAARRGAVRSVNAIMTATCWAIGRRIVEQEQRGNHAVAKYALEGLPNKVLAAEYRTALPDERLFVQAIEKTRKQLETCGGSRRRLKGS